MHNPFFQFKKFNVILCYVVIAHDRQQCSVQVNEALYRLKYELFKKDRMLRRLYPGLRPLSVVFKIYIITFQYM